MKQKLIYKTALIVTLFSVCERFLGFLYRIILSRTLGSEGLGIYSISLTVFAVFVTITSSGIPITVSRLITKHKAERQEGRINATITAGIILTVVFSIVVVLALVLGDGLFSFIFADKRCMNVLLIMLPGLIFTSVYAVVRGSFWGNKSFLVYSVIEFVEEVTMIIVGTLLVIYSSSIYSGAMRAGFAISASYLVSFLMSVFYFFIKGGKLKNPHGEFKPLISSAVPITLMRTGSSLINSLVAILLPQRLIYFGLTNAQALSEFGIVYGMSIPLLFMPSTIIGSIALVLVPELSENFYSKNNVVLKNNIENALKLTGTIACVMIPLFVVLGVDLGTLVYSNVKSGQIISYFAFMLLPLSLSQISTSILNSIGCEKNTLIYYSFGAVAMLLCVYFLPQFIGVYALCVGEVLSYLISSISNLVLTNKKSPIKLHYQKHILIVGLLTIPVIIFGLLIHNILTLLMSAIFAFIITGILMLGLTYIIYKLFNVVNFKLVKELFKSR